MIEVRITTPHAGILIWNYTDRMVEPFGASNNTQDTEPLFVTSAHVRSIRTVKTKSSPAGNFEIELAPTYNWIAKLTIGSWLAILMTKNILLDYNSTNPGRVTAKPDELKMIGRIDSIRLVVSVNQKTGARQTGYVITGRDWASVFESNVYIDTLLTAVSQQPAGVSTLFGNVLINYEQPKDNKSLFSTTECIEAIRELYGKVGAAPFNDSWFLSNFKLFPDQMFQIPNAVSSFLGLTDPITSNPSNRVGDMVSIISGKLTGKDQYDLTHRESVGLPNLSSMLGQHTYWQVLMDHSNPVLNEMFAELRWEQSKTPTIPGATLISPPPYKLKLALYKRIKPFVVSLKSLKSELILNTVNDPSASLATNVVNDLASIFTNLKSTEIPLEDIITIDAGNNWRDKINFIEVLFDDAVIKKTGDSLQSMIKPSSQIKDANAITREGLKPLMLTTKFFPPPDKIADFAKNNMNFAPLAVTNWKYLLRAWYFNVHNMLNGSVTIIGQNNFIGVGENIMIPVKALGLSNNFFEGMNLYTQTLGIYLLAHVESVTNQFVVTDNGERSFSSIIQFVRGIFIQYGGSVVSPLGYDGVLDSLSFSQTDAERKTPNTVITPSRDDVNIEPSKNNISLPANNIENLV